jgi:hypothetical protein
MKLSKELKDEIFMGVVTGVVTSIALVVARRYLAQKRLKK